MTRRERAQSACGLAMLMLTLSAMAHAALAEQAPAPERQREIIQLLQQDCGSCHGLTLKGGLGPPLTPDALAGKPAATLQATIVNGRPGTPMAPWRPFLNDTEAAWLVERLLQGKTHAP